MLSGVETQCKYGWTTNNNMNEKNEKNAYDVNETDLGSKITIKK